MKSTLIAAAILALFATSASATNTNTAGASGSNVVVSGSTSTVSASGTGSATSSAYNQGQAITTVGSLTSASGPTAGGDRSASAEVFGTTITRNLSGVTTTDSGAGASSFGAASGVAYSQASGSGNFHSVNDGPTGNVSGSASSLTATGVISSGNGSAVQNAGRTSSFDSAASASIAYTTTPILNSNGNETGAVVRTDIKNAATSTSGTSVSNGGFTQAAWTNGPQVSIANSVVGNASGALINVGGATATANASVAGQVATGNRQ